MDKITFENGIQVSPARVNEDGTITPAQYEGNTPFSAHIMNLLQEKIEKSVVAVSPTQPTTNERVWIKKGKNLINKIINGYELYSADGSIGINADWCVTDYIEVVAGSNYVVSGLSSQNKYWYDENYNFIGRVTTNPSQAPNNAKYVRLNSLIAGCSNPILIQGSQIGTYEPYVEKEILVKNDNEVFEKFYCENDIPSYIRSKTVTGTPDSNGFLVTGLGLNNVIIGISDASQTAFYTPFYGKTENRLTIKCETWQRVAITTEVTITIHYIPLN